MSESQGSRGFRSFVGESFPTLLPLSLKAPSTILPPLTDQTAIDLVSNTARASRDARVFDLAPSEARRIKNAASKENAIRFGSHYQNSKSARRNKQSRLSNIVKQSRVKLAEAGIPETYVAAASLENGYTDDNGNLSAASLKQVGEQVISLFWGEDSLVKSDYEELIYKLKPEYYSEILKHKYLIPEDREELPDY